MCTIAILLEVVAGAPLVVAANRDEIYARPTRPPELLAPHVAGGVDALSGGTWLAIHRDGRFAAVTNQRALAPVAQGLRSRGLAVRELIAADDPERYVAAIDPTQYASMNLVWGDARAVSIAYARREGTLEIERLPRGIHVVCNGRLGADGFPRGARLHDAIARAELVRTERSRSIGLLPEAPKQRSEGRTECGERGGRMDYGLLAWPALLPALEAALADHTRV